MAKFDKNFNIPRGTDEEYEAIRNSLRKRIQNYEKNMPQQNLTDKAPVHANDEPAHVNQSKVDVQSAFQGSSKNTFDAKGQQQSLSFEQYKQNLNQDNNTNQYPFVTPRNNTYDSPFTKSSGNDSPFAKSSNNDSPFAKPSGNDSPFAKPSGNDSPFARHSNNDSPFAQPSGTVNFQQIQQPAIASATHSKEPVTYKPKQRKSAGKTFLFLLLLVAIILGLSWALREFVFQAYEIPSGSMEKTIMTGDMVFAEKVSYKLGSPKAKDIVTFNDPLNDGRILIKRVIATEGQVVDIKDNKLYVNGVEQYEDYVGGLPTTALRSSSVKYPYVVPAGQLWVMGDNRTNSQDSRYFGSIPVDSVIGQALVVYWPVSNAKNLV